MTRLFAIPIDRRLTRRSRYNREPRRSPDRFELLYSLYYWDFIEMCRVEREDHNWETDRLDRRNCRLVVVRAEAVSFVMMIRMATVVVVVVVPFEINIHTH